MVEIVDRLNRLLQILPPIPPQHRLGHAEALRCRNDHFVAPTIARDTILKPRLAGPDALPTGGLAPASSPKIIKLQNMSAKSLRRRKIRAHNHQMRARTLRRQRDGG